ncbi:MAG TPA: HK97 family phage prohead protease [Sphingomonas sp.]
MTLRFAGYAALFDTVDRGGDVIRKGAFARTIASAQGVPLLWQHRPERPIGRIESLSEDARGLRVIGRLTPQAGHADEAAALLRDGAVGGLSFGYRVRAKEQRPPHGRTLTDLDLVEVSLVTFPMQPGARVHAVHEEDKNV